jgi:hypothetical protein
MDRLSLQLLKQRNGDSPDATVQMTPANESLPKKLTLPMQTHITSAGINYECRK